MLVCALSSHTVFGIMSILPDEVWLCIAGDCDGATSNAMASVCQQFRQVFRRNRPFVFIATPARIQSGLFRWLERYVSRSAGGVDGPPMGSLTIVLPVMAHYKEESDRQLEHQAAVGLFSHTLHADRNTSWNSCRRSESQWRPFRI